jgi:hypothetical protein
MGASQWRQTRNQRRKEKLDEWYIRNASLWLDLRIAMMTIKLLLRGRVSSQEILADAEQVQSKNNGLGVASGEEWFARTRLNAQ